MNPKRMIIAGTMAFAIAVSMLSDETSASSITGAAPKSGVQPTLTEKAAPQEDCFLEALGAASEEDVYDALYNGQSLSQIAESNEADVQPIIDLQIAEMTVQLNERLLSGSLTLGEYHAQLAELPEIITRSVYG
ncbi:hypothetical protein [Paenibacillus sp. GCM10027626]|uniref:hypothetical protein n=1 Tax=Paenibacillus sp. GCM10027626 TaxID=3273411 RepID=UPI003633D02E